ncbi:MAG: cytochrome c biogenesis protein ResB [Chloroflexi bacterium]|nr:cytochrome c biogenesis protein ResB [Chloroflexota bacterium]
MAAMTARLALRPRMRGGARPWRLGKMVRLLRSRELALALMALVALAALSGTLVPQQALVSPAEFRGWRQANPGLAALGEALGLTQVYSSGWFLGLLAGLFVCLSTWTWVRAAQVWKLDQARHRPVPASLRAPGRHLTVPLEARAEEALETAAGQLAAAGYRAYLHRWDGPAGRPDRQTWLFAEKGRYGVWGSLAMHASLLVILLGGLYSGGFKMAGYFELAEGQTFSGQRAAFLQHSTGPFSQGQESAVSPLRLDALTTAYWPDGSLREISSALSLSAQAGPPAGRADGPRAATVSVSNPLVRQSTTIYQARDHGFAALLELRDPRGAVTSGYINFPTPRERSQPASNRFSVPGTPYRAEADFYPAPGVGPVPAEAWLQAQPEQPWLYLFLKDAQGAVAYQGPLGVGQAVVVEGSALTFRGVSRWAGFPVVRDPGLSVIFAGFALCILGAALLYLWIPRRAWAWLEQDASGRPVLCLAARADRYPQACAEELAELAARMEALHGRP